MKEILEMCKTQRWILIEDVCEAIGTTSDGQVVGTFGDFACGSLYANKIVTAGDGGWVMTKDKTKHDRLKSLVNHGFDPLYHFLHFETAPNAKINGLGAALACASIDKIPEVNVPRNWLIGEYRKALKGTPLALIEEGEKNEPREFLGKHQIETRNYFFPLHMQPVNFF